MNVHAATESFCIRYSNHWLIMELDFQSSLLPSFHIVIMELAIPIPNFPPFKLRSSLIDKDPVIWEHLLNDYLVLFQKLLAILPKRSKDPPQYVLTVQTKTQLHLFISTFLSESAGEAGQVFSLGAINPNIRQNQHLLKLAVFNYIKRCNLVNLKIQGKSCWNFCKVYLVLADSYAQAKVNQSFITVPMVRKLVLGETRSSVNGKSDDVSLIRSLQDHLAHLVAGGQWKAEDDVVLFLLLGQKTKKSLNSGARQGPRRINKGSAGAAGVDFAEVFVNDHWVDVLGEMYANGEGVNSKLCVQIMSFSLCALATVKVVSLLRSLDIKTFTQLKTFYPLIAKIVLSKTFNDLNPDLKDQMAFLRAKSKPQMRTFDATKIASVESMFPQLSQGQIKTMLVAHSDSVEEAINALLEMEDVSKVDEYVPRAKPSNVVDFNLNKDTKVEVMFGKKERTLEEVDGELRKKTLAMLYDAQEDEPDDTYVNNEITTGSRQDTNMQEQVLFGLFKTNRAALDRTQRNTPARAELKRELKWSDEQIEGWARMLEKSPARFRDLEDRLMYVDGNLNVRSGKQRSKWSASEGGQDKRRGNRLPVKDTANFQHYMNKKKEQRKGTQQKLQPRPKTTKPTGDNA